MRSIPNTQRRFANQQNGL